MNVTVKLDDRLVKVARHLAVDSGVSLSGFLAMLIQREASGRRKGKARSKGLLDALGDEEGAGLEFAPPRLKDEPEGVGFES